MTPYKFFLRNQNTYRNRHLRQVVGKWPEKQHIHQCYRCKKILKCFKHIYESFFQNGMQAVLKNDHIFTYTSPNCTGVREIDNTNRCKEFFDTYYILKVSENFSWAMFQWSVFKKFTFLMVKAFISNFTYFCLY